MKNLLILFICVLSTVPLAAQDEVHAKLDEAKKSYSSGDLENARYSLQQSMAELDILLCKEVLAVLPTELGGLSYVAEEDNVSGSALIVGSSVERNYQEGEKSVKFHLMNNSPMLSMVTAFLTNPLFASTADGSQKQVKVSGHKAVLQNNNTETNDSFTIQIPLNQSLLSLEFNEFTEQEALKVAETLNMADILEIIN